MNEGWLLDALGGGLVGKTIVGSIGLIGGIWVSRANIMNAVTKRVNALIGHLEDEIGRLTKRCEAAEAQCSTMAERHAQCEANLADVRREVADLLNKADQISYTNPKPTRRK